MIGASMRLLVSRSRFGAVGQGSRNDDDFVDRLSSGITSAILIIFSLVVTAKEYVGDPINCWVPAHFSGVWEEYTNNYCWVKNTYYLPFHEYIPKEQEEEKRNMITYYQWVPLILVAQGLVCYLPVLLWRTLNGRSCIDVNNMVESAEMFGFASHWEDRDKTMNKMTTQMGRYLETQRVEGKMGHTISLKHCLSALCCFVCGRRKGNYLVFVYFITKFVYLANAIGQLFMLNLFLGQDFHMYGIEWIQSMYYGDIAPESERFPRVTMCDFKIRRLGNVQRYTVQCCLGINLYIEKIYLFIWFWFALLSAVTVLSVLSWIAIFAFPGDRHRYVKRMLSGMGVDFKQKENKDLCAKFVQNYLRSDGYFVLRLISHNTTEITVMEFTKALFDKYKARKLKLPSPNAKTETQV